MTIEQPKQVMDASGAAAFIQLVQQDVKTQFATPQTESGGKAAAPSDSQSTANTFAANLKSADVEGLTLSNAITSLTSIATKAGMPVADVQKLQQTIQSQTTNAGPERPADVSCSFSIMTWHETDEFFGRMVANDYIAIEVNLRNLNKENEFLVHDIQVAVDTGLDKPTFGRFEAGRDKMIVRGVAQRGASDDIRNRIMNSLSMLGSVAGGASGALTASAAIGSTWPTYLSESVSIFQGPLIDGLNKIWPDHTITNVNNVSDMAFSASSTMKTVVPIQGSVPLVTFIAQKPLGQLPFAQCGRLTSDHYKSDEICSAGAPQDSTSHGFEKELVYKKWAPAALDILKHRTYVVVAGVHIQEVSSAAVANSMSCPIVTDGTVDLSAQDSTGDVSCTIQGKSLDKAASASLEQGTAAKVSGTLKPAADANSTTLTFKASDLAGKNGTYELFFVDSASKETNSGQSIKFAVRAPVISNVTYAPSGALNPANPLSVTISGTNLDRIASVLLQDNNSPPDAPVAGSIIGLGTVRASATSISVAFDPAQLALLLGPSAKPGTGVANMEYTTLDDIATTKTNLKVTPSQNDPGVKLPKP
jgi:hypothetical protein